MDFDLSVYFIVDQSVCRMRAPEHVAAAAVRGGVSMVQLRNKVDPLDVIEEQARGLQRVLKGTGVALIINDHVELAVKVDADGVHVGQDDRDPGAAREMIGAGKILGVTAYTRAQYEEIDPSVVDYVGTGPVYPTKTKPDKPILGVGGFADLIKYAPVPVVGIGGIAPENARAVVEAGADGVAMMRGISEAEDVEYAAREFVEAVS